MAVQHTEDGKIDWRCCGCGIATPERTKRCACMTNVCYSGDRTEWMVGELVEDIGEYSRSAALRQRIEELERALESVARWAWRTDPPGSNVALTDAERLNAIKFHPTIKALAQPHIELAGRERAALGRKA